MPLHEVHVTDDVKLNQNEFIMEVTLLLRHL